MCLPLLFLASFGFFPDFGFLELLPVGKAKNEKCFEIVLRD
jgi:hypothetical protein